MQGLQNILSSESSEQLPWGETVGEVSKQVIMGSNSCDYFNIRSSSGAITHSVYVKEYIGNI